MNTNKATNVYERMLIEFYNEFLTEYAPKNELKHIEEDINQEILASGLKDEVALYEYIQEYFEICDCTDGTEPYPRLISYETGDTRRKHQEYYKFIVGVLDKDLLEFKIEADGVEYALLISGSFTL